MGCGKMGSALLSQWVAGPESVTVVDPMASDLPEGVALVPDREKIASQRFDCIVAAVKPQLIDEVMPAYRENIAPGGYILSIAAGYSAGRLSRLMGDAPVVRTMPNLPAAIGRGVSGICPGPHASSDHLVHAEAFMRRAGSTITVDSEEKLDRVTAVAGSGPGYVFEIARAYAEAAMAQGFDEDEARDMVLGTMGGAVAMASEPSAPGLEELRNSVTSKGGTTAAGLDALNSDDGLSDRLHATLQAAYDRAVELR
ncbi:pyrroline-5-carboxylate reductase family protein [Qipengyuania xiapuensis]|uniref:pyrroline-5-carboxylate reductase family protein n=1 Tax=Qipengyuania xiapuensis TaxID=2867236 RepID=UPI002493FA90|nr:pyrroline-5-carboxylate reductase [Qipengyuania xiapuensis]